MRVIQSGESPDCYVNAGTLKAKHMEMPKGKASGVDEMTWEEYDKNSKLKDYIEERAIELANYIVEEKTPVRSAAKEYGISKSTVHIVVTNQNYSN